MAEVTAEMDLEIARLRRKLGQANNRLDKFAKDARKKGERFGRNFHSGIGKLLKGGLAGLGIGLGVAAAGTLAGKTFVDALKEASKNEQLEVSVEVLTGDAGTAKKLIEELRQGAASTPLSFDDYGGAAKKLLAFGSAARDVPEELRRIGDISTAIQAPLGEIAEIYGKARVQGTLFAEDINQLTGRGIPVIQQFAKQLGVGTGEVKKMGSEGKITFENLRQAIIDMTSEGGQFEGMMARQSTTLGGLTSTLLDNIKQVRLEFGKPIADAIKPILEDGIGLVERMKERAREMGESMAKGIDFVRAAFQELSGGDLLALAGKSLQLAFMESVNVLAKGVQAVFAAAEDAQFMGELDSRLDNFAARFKEALLEGLGVALDAMKDLPGIGVDLENAGASMRLAASQVRIDERERQKKEKDRPKVDLVAEIGKKFSEAKDILPTDELKQEMFDKMFAVQVRAAVNRADREGKKAFGEEGDKKPPAEEAPKPVAAPVGVSGPTAQDAVNALFGRPMEAEAKRQSALLTSIDKRLANIEKKEPAKQRPQLPQQARFYP